MFSANGPLVSGLKYKGTVGLEVDKQQITIAARSSDVINGAPFLIALRDGAFDGAPVYRDRVFLTAPQGSVVGGVRLFQGRVSTVDNVGRTQATLTVASDLVILDYDMPKNLFSPTCLHVLYDAGCGVIRGTYSADGVVGAGSTSNSIAWSGARAGDAQGSLVFTSGANANIRATVKAAAAGSGYTLMYPLPFAPATGDTFNVAFGCDHTQATCQGNSTISRISGGFHMYHLRNWPTEKLMKAICLLIALVRSAAARPLMARSISPGIGRASFVIRRLTA